MQLEADVFKPAQSERARRIVLVPKRNEIIRFCVDYRCLNAATMSNTYLLPRMNACFDNLGEAQVSTALTSLLKFWEAPMKDEDKDKLHSPLILVLSAALVYHLAYTTHLLRSSVSCRLSYPESNKSRVLFI